MNFKEECYKILKKVPYGKVITYGAVAQALGLRGARAVGTAMHFSPGMPKVPCHRVVRSDGKIGGFNRGINEKIRLLRKEGIEVKKGKIDLDKYKYCLR